MKAIWADNTPFSKFMITVGVILISAVAFTILAVGIVTSVYGISVEEMQKVMDGDSLQSLNIMRIVQTLASLGTFVLPPFFLAYTFGGNPKAYLGLDKTPKTISFLYVILLMILATPLINFLSEVNSSMHLPGAMKSLEDWMRAQEDKAAKITKQFLEMHSVKSLLFNLFMVGFLPALGEELVFRGVVQKLFHQWSKNAHLAIWVTAILFSALHMQFYGFIPRMLLGAMLGYLYLWSGSLWLPILGHFVNNGGAVLFTYLFTHGHTTIDPDKVGAQSDFLSVAISIVIVIMLFYFIRKSEKSQLREG